MPSLKSTAMKLLAAIGGMVGSVLCLRLTHADIFFFSFIAGFIFSLLYWIDLGGQLRDIENPRVWQRMLGIAFGVPQALLGLTSIAIGVAIIGWVLYNSLIERTPEYSGSFLSMGIGPMLIAGGVFWVVLAFKRDLPAAEDETADT